ERAPSDGINRTGRNSIREMTFVDISALAYMLRLTFFHLAWQVRVGDQRTGQDDHVGVILRNDALHLPRIVDASSDDERRLANFLNLRSGGDVESRGNKA